MRNEKSTICYWCSKPLSLSRRQLKVVICQPCYELCDNSEVSDMGHFPDNSTLKGNEQNVFVPQLEVVQ